MGIAVPRLFSAVKRRASSGCRYRASIMDHRRLAASTRRYVSPIYAANSTAHTAHTAITIPRALPRFQKERGTDDPGDEETKQYRGNPEWHKHTSFQRKIIAKTAPPTDTAEKRRFFAAPTAAERGADRWLSPWSRERRGTPPAVRPWCAAWSRPGWRQREIRSRPRGKA